MMKLPQDFKEFLSLLNAHKVNYLLIGGYAVGLHGFPRATGDMDIWVDSEESNAKRVLCAIGAFGFDQSQIPIENLTKSDQIVRMGVPPIQIEVITSISGVTFKDCFARKEVVELDDTFVFVISLNDLKTNKMSAGRHKDLNDLENL